MGGPHRLAISGLITIGIVMFVSGVLLALPCASVECHLTPLLNSLAVVPLIGAILAFVAGYRLWSGSKKKRS